MQGSAALYGILGLIALIFAAIAYFLTAGFLPYVIVNLLAGLFLIVMWISSGWAGLGSFVGQRSTRYGANAIVYSAIFVLILVAVNYISSQHHARIDLTSEKVYSLSTQSVQVVRSLQKPLKIYGFFQGGDNPTARQLYEEYAYASPKVTFQMVDPDRHPELAEKYKVSVMNTTHLQYGGDGGEGSNVTEHNEEALTNAIIRVSKATKKTIYFLDGHGEPDPDNTTDQTGFGQIKSALEGEGFQIKKLLLATQAAVPDDCTILVVAGPAKPLRPHEIEAIDAYLNKGGRLLVMFQAPRPNNEYDETALVNLIAKWGVQAGKDVVVDQVVRLFAGPALGLNPLVQNYPDHAITHGFKERTIFPMARSVEPLSDAKGLTVTALAKTSDTSWGETDIDGIFKRQEAKLDASDTRGPLDVVDAVEKDVTPGAEKARARLVVFGSTEFANNQWITQFFNRDFFVNSTDWLAGEENQISIRPRGLRASRFRLTVDQSTVVFILSVLLLPELLLIIGIVVWWERRN